MSKSVHFKGGSQKQPPRQEEDWGEDDEYKDDFERDTPLKQEAPKGEEKGKAQTQEVRPAPSQEEYQINNQTNRYIIHKFMKKGFTALSAEDLACTMVNPDFTSDFRRATGEDWVQKYQFKIIERLHKCKFNLQWVTKRQGAGEAHEPFFQMVREGRIDRVIDYLRQPSVQPAQVLDAVEKQTKKSALHIAAHEGHAQMVEFLLNKGARVDARDKLLRTPLHLACQSGQLACAKFLVESNADPFDKDSSGRTTLHYACCSGSVELCTLLCYQGPDLVHIKDHNGRTALHYAVFNAHPKSVEMVVKLLQLGADVNALDEDRRTVLHHAAEAGKARLIPVLVQKGASTGTRDKLTNKTPMELAANDHIKELIIVYSSPQYIPKQEDINQLDNMIEGNKVKMEKEPYDPFGVSFQPRQGTKKINQKAKQSSGQKPSSEQQAMEDSFQRSPLGPVKQWENTRSEYLPYNMKNYQERLFQYLKRVQEFGVQSYMHVKKPYMFTGSWMEYVRTLDDLMLQINGCPSNEAVLKIFNIMFPYDKPLPQGKGDEVSLQGFYSEGGKKEGEPDVKDCHPDVLRERIEKEQEMEREAIGNQKEDINDLLSVKKQLMALESANNLLQQAIEEKDNKIQQLYEQVGSKQQDTQLSQQKQIPEDQYNLVLAENEHLKSLVSRLNDQLSQTEQKLDQLSKMVESDQMRRLNDSVQEKQLGASKELQSKNSELERLLQDEKERNKALRFKAGQAFLQQIEQAGEKKPSAKESGDYYLEDDDALMRLLQRVQQAGEPGLQQRVKAAGDPATGMVSKTQLTLWLRNFGMTQIDILSIMRVVGFTAGKDKLPVSDIMTKITERSKKRGEIEEETVRQLANDIKSKGYTLEEAFDMIDTNNSNCIEEAELQSALAAMKVQVSQQVVRNIIHLFDVNKDNQISKQEFYQVMSQHFDNNNAQKQKGRLLEEEVKEEPVAQPHKHQIMKAKFSPEEEKQNAKEMVRLEDTLSSLKAHISKREERQNQRIAALQSGSLPPEEINGEIKMQFGTGSEIMKVVGKDVAYISITISNFVEDSKGGFAVQKESQLFSCPAFDSNLPQSNFNRAIRIPFKKKDKNKIDEFFSIEFYKHAAEGEKGLKGAVFIGEIEYEWKKLLKSENQGQFMPETHKLEDPARRSIKEVTGQAKVFGKWIPAGEKESSMDESGMPKAKQSKAPQPAQEGIDQYRKQQSGSQGKLEIYPLEYMHPTAIPQPAKEYYLDFQLGEAYTQSERSSKIQVKVPQSTGAEEGHTTINFTDVKTLAVGDVMKDRNLVLRILDAGGAVVATGQINLFKQVYASTGNPVPFPKQEMVLDDGSKGHLKLKLKYVHEESSPASQQQFEEKKEEAVVEKQGAQAVAGGQKEEVKRDAPVQQKTIGEKPKGESKGEEKQKQETGFDMSGQAEEIIIGSEPVGNQEEKFDDDFE